MLKNKLRHFYYNFRARIKYFINKRYFFPELKIMNDEQTVEEILNGKSISRFGDGELSLIINNEAIGYQDADCSLNKALRAVLKKPSDNLIVCVPRGLAYREDLTRKAKWFWVWYLSMYKEKIYPLLDKEYEYGNTNFTRFYMDLKDKSKTKNKVKSLKKIWDRKKILIIEGEKTRLGVTNDLFGNATSVNRFIVPSKNAFRKYRLILEKAIKISKKYDLVLLSIGPTATVLANDLSRNGIQAVDIGHIDVEYEWYRRSAKKKVALRGKMVNEVKHNGSEGLTKKEEESYWGSIIEVVR